MSVARLVALALALTPVLAAAQPQPQPLPNPQAVVVPPPPTVEDPDLQPLPPAKRVVRSWDEITAYLRAYSADLRVGLDEVGRAEAQRRVALAGVLGTIAATGTYTHNVITTTNVATTPSGLIPVTSPYPDYVQGSLSGTLPIIAPQAWANIKTADVNLTIQRSSLDDIKRTLATNVANAALTTATDERVAELNRVGLRQALERLELAKRKTSLGAGTGLDVIRAQQDVESARSTLVSGDETARQAREAFGLSIGVAEDVSVAGDISFESLTREVLSQCKPAPTVEDRPDVIKARQQVAFERANVWTFKALYFPSLSLQSAIGTTSIPYVFPQTTWNVQAVLSWTLWDGGARYGNVRDAKLQVLEAQDRLEATRRTAIIQVVQADRGVAVAQQTRDVSQRARDLAAEVDRLTRQGFMTGLYTSLDLVTAAAALRQAEINLAVAEYGLIKAKVLAVLALATCPL